MGVEIERKFLLRNNDWQNKNLAGTRYVQGYLPSGGGIGTRIRIAGNKGILTIKTPVKGISRSEFEYEIPLEDARIMLHTLCAKPLISKVRYKIEYRSFIWEVDVFDGDNAGLIVAEVELESENQSVELPEWIGTEVTGDMKYYNSKLVGYPYSKWTDEERGEI